MSGISKAKLRGAIIGCGFFAQYHLDAWRRMPQVEMAAACDVMLERAQQSAPRAYASAAEMLDREQLDFVDVATLPEQHLPLVHLASERRIPIICQKPMAPTWDEAVSMVRTAEAVGVPLMIHENWRWQPWFRVAKQMIMRGELGELVTYHMRLRRRDGLGPEPYQRQPYWRHMPRLLIHEMLVHQIDTARFLFGDVSAVYAETRRINPVIAGEDQALITLTHADEMRGVIDGHRMLDTDPDGPASGETRIEGTKAFLRIAATGDVYRGSEKVWTNIVREGYKGDSVRATQEHFIHCLQTGEPFETGAREYLNTFGVIEAAYQSAAEKRAIPLTGWRWS